MWRIYVVLLLLFAPSSGFSREAGYSYRFQDKYRDYFYLSERLVRNLSHWLSEEKDCPSTMEDWNQLQNHLKQITLNTRNTGINGANARNKFYEKCGTGPNRCLEHFRDFDKAFLEYNRLQKLTLQVTPEKANSMMPDLFKSKGFSEFISGEKRSIKEVIEFIKKNKPTGETWTIANASARQSAIGNTFHINLNGTREIKNNGGRVIVDTNRSPPQFVSIVYNYTEEHSKESLEIKRNWGNNISVVSYDSETEPNGGYLPRFMDYQFKRPNNQAPFRLLAVDEGGRCQSCHANGPITFSGIELFDHQRQFRIQTDEINNSMRKTPTALDPHLRKMGPTIGNEETIDPEFIKGCFEDLRRDNWMHYSKDFNKNLNALLESPQKMNRSVGKVHESMNCAKCHDDQKSPDYGGPLKILHLGLAPPTLMVEYGSISTHIQSGRMPAKSKFPLTGLEAYALNHCLMKRFFAAEGPWHQWATQKSCDPAAASTTDVDGDAPSTNTLEVE